MEELSEEDKEAIIRALQRRNKRAWKEGTVYLVIDTLNKIRQGTILLKDWFVQDSVDYETLLLDLDLIKYVKT